jgi:hypothetical protein
LRTHAKAKGRLAHGRDRRTRGSSKWKHRWCLECRDAVQNGHRQAEGRHNTADWHHCVALALDLLNFRHKRTVFKTGFFN